MLGNLQKKLLAVMCDEILEGKILGFHYEEYTFNCFMKYSQDCHMKKRQAMTYEEYLDKKLKYEDFIYHLYYETYKRNLVVKMNKNMLYVCGQAV